ncbi:MAG: hypothetical protein ACP5N7_07380 [Candidatus Pacearchaeota archaeon]
MEIILGILVIAVGVLDVIVSRRELKEIQRIANQQNDAIVKTLEGFLIEHWKINGEQIDMQNTDTTMKVSQTDETKIVEVPTRSKTKRIYRLQNESN